MRRDPLRFQELGQCALVKRGSMFLLDLGRPYFARVWPEIGNSFGEFNRHRSWLTCRRVPLAERLHHLYDTAGVAFMYGSGEWKCSIELWWQCMVHESHWLCATIPSAFPTRRP